MRPWLQGSGNGLCTLAATWIADTLTGELNYRSMGIDGVDAKKFTGLLVLLKAGTITDKSGVEVLRVMLDERLKDEPVETPEAIVSRLNLAKTSGDDNALMGAIHEVITENQKAVEDYRTGKNGSPELPCRPDHEKDPGPRRSGRTQPADGCSTQKYGAVT